MALTPAHDMLSSLSILVLVLLRPQGPYGLLILWFSVLFSRGFGLPLMYQFYSLQSIIYFNIFSCIIGCLWPQCPYPLHYIALHLIYCPRFPFFFKKKNKKTFCDYFVCEIQYTKVFYFLTQLKEEREKRENWCCMRGLSRTNSLRACICVCCWFVIYVCTKSGCAILHHCG